MPFGAQTGARQSVGSRLVADDQFRVLGSLCNGPPDDYLGPFQIMKVEAKYAPEMRD